MPDADRIVDLVIVVATVPEADEISARFAEAGLRMADEVVEANMGIRSRLHPIAGGGFIELATEVTPGGAAHSRIFAETPRLVAVAYTTPDVHGDLERWKRTPGSENAFASCGSWRRSDGRFGYYLSIASGPPIGDVAFALRDRRLFPSPFPSDSAPEVRQVTVHGPDVSGYRKQHTDLFSLPSHGDHLRAGDTEIVFEETGTAKTELTLTLAVPNPDVHVPLAAGRFEFVPEQKR
ncbi:VOC family protein [Amycolatopsis jejuensis]|uniref:VOC family protein n=1 Tax=Amycolatopsis jejuensis TaxID=330084 RepID=UPI0005275183|nr:VOC family protein [Amycolatopsis jejuensis]